MSNIISFGSLVVRDVTGVNTPKYGNGSLQGATLDDTINKIDFDDLVFSSAINKAAYAALSQAQKDAILEQFIVGGSDHIENRDFFAIVSDQALKSSDFTQGGKGDTGTGSLYKLSDSGFGDRLLGDNDGTVNDGKIGDGADPITIVGFGRTGNNTVGSADAGLQAGGQGVSFNATNGFGFDNAPESGGRWLNNGDSIKFALNKEGGTDQAIRKLSFTVLTDQPQANVAFSFTDGVLKGGSYNSAANLSNLAADLFQVTATNGQLIEIDFDLGIFKVGGAVIGTPAAAAFFAAFNASQQNALTIGATDGQRFTIGPDLAIERIDDNSGRILPGSGVPVLSLDAFLRQDGDASPIPGEGTNNERHAYAYLDIDGDNVLDAGEVATVEKLQFKGADSSGDGDSNPTQGDGNTGPRNDLIDLYVRGIADTTAASGHQYGDIGWAAVADGGLPGRFNLGVDTASPADLLIGSGPNGSPLDIDPGTGNLGDESGGRYVNTGEVVGFVLKVGATSGLIRYANGLDHTPGTNADIIIRLYDGSTLLETITHNIANTTTGTETGTITFADNFGQVFNRVEVQAAGSTNGLTTTDAGARFTLTDADFVIDGLGEFTDSSLKAVHQANGTRLFIDDVQAPSFIPASPNANNGPVVNVNDLFTLTAREADGTPGSVRFDQGEGIGVATLPSDTYAKRVNSGETLGIARNDGEASETGTLKLQFDGDSFDFGNETRITYFNNGLIVGQQDINVTDVDEAGRPLKTLALAADLGFDAIEVTALGTARFTLKEVLFDDIL